MKSRAKTNELGCYHKNTVDEICPIVLKPPAKKTNQCGRLEFRPTYIIKLSIRNTIPPRKIANVTSKTVMPEAFFQPNSLARQRIRARQGT